MNNSLHYKSAEEALSMIRSGDRVFIQGNAATPTYLLNKLAERAHELHDVELGLADALLDGPRSTDNLAGRSEYQGLARHRTEREHP